MASESGAAVPWRSLHPASVVVNLVPRTWAVLRSMWPIFLVILFGGRADGESIFDAVLLLLFLLMTVGGTVLHWLTLRYRVSEGRLEVMTGLLNRQTRVISPDRIQNMELVRNVFHRLSGLVEIRIETASGTEVEGMLSALSVAEAEELTGALEALRSGAPEQDAEEALPVIAENDLGDLFRYGATATRLGAALVVIGFLFEGQRRLDTGFDLFSDLGWAGFMLALLAILTGTWLVGSARAVAQHYGFKLMQTAGSLITTEGLFTRRRVELPTDKVQLVTVSEPILRRFAGFGTIHIETAAARAEGGGVQNAMAMVPVVESGRLYEVVRELVPALNIDLENAVLEPPAIKALIRSLIAVTWQAVLFVVAVSWWFWPWGLLSMVAVPLSWGAAWLDHKHQGWLVTDEVVVSRQGYLNRETRIVARGKLQSTEISQGVFLRRYGLGRLAVRVAGNAVSLPILKFDDAIEVQKQLLRQKRPTTPKLTPPFRGSTVGSAAS